MDFELVKDKTNTHDLAHDAHDDAVTPSENSESSRG